MSLNMKSLTQALAKTAAAIEKTVQSTVQEVTGPKALQDYELLDQVGSGGPDQVWKLYLGKPRNKAAQAHNPEVCVWVLDKRALAEARQRVGISKAAEDAFLDIIRADAAQLMRLRHPGIVRVVQGLDDSKGSMVMVTEPIFASVANLLGYMENVPKIPKELKGLVVFVTSSGAWKLGGFGHAINLDQVGADANSGPAYHYPDYDVEDFLMPLQPYLNYTAPELTRSQGTTRTTSDMFSLACLSYHLLARKPLIQCKNNLRTYASTVTYLMNENFSALPSELVPDLRRMLNVDVPSRPSAIDFTGSPFFRDDVRLRALRFLDHMLERDNMQKAEFLKALGNMWTDFDSRILRYKVLPPLCAELRNLVMQPMVLPMVLTIAEAQEKKEFELSTFPALLPVLTTASGDSLLLLVKHAALLIKQVNPDQLVGSVVPMLVRAYDDPDARIQEEVLRRTLSFSKQLDYPVLTQSVLPRVHSLSLKTTVAAVRVNALLCLGKLVHRMDKPAILDVLQTLQRCTAVDHSAPTLMCTLEVATSIYKQFGIEFSAEQLLPLLTPLLIAQQLNPEQFGKYMLFIKEILRKIEEKRGVGCSENEINTSGSLSSFQGGVNGHRTAGNGVGSSILESSGDKNWDDWNPHARSQKIESTPNMSLTDRKTSDSVTSSSSYLASLTPVSWVTSTPPMSRGHDAGVSYSASNLEWPPSSTKISLAGASSNKPANMQAVFSASASWDAVSSSTISAVDQSNSNKTAYSGNSFNLSLDPVSLSDEADPFADWPPPRHGSINSTSTSIREETSFMQNTVYPNSKDSYNSKKIGAQKWATVSDPKEFQKDHIDVATFFGTNATVQPQPSPLRLAPPPPSTGLGKGRGRNPIRPIGSAHVDLSESKPSSQPSALDLL
ncbi:hypothetical protein O6H91_08G038400 [Diphasiastrum complanatum]|uniref:Uncharacterized protein n=1 Tax=Diphasiastrum complanatum TaxID=34168 RepID=A0ACC2CWP6_DIPCM|nr:hypothetical protein O6H91_08G038400 [Diphasiastrum complanatum]